LFKCKVFEALPSKPCTSGKAWHAFPDKRIATMSEFVKICDFGELQGFALRINRFAVYSVDIMIAQKYKL